MPAGAPRVLVVYAQAGSLGHRVLAENYAALLSEAGNHTRLLDVFPCGGFLAALGAQAYRRTISYLPHAWRKVYARHDDACSRYLRGSLLPALFRRASAEIAEFGPDLVVTTHPIASAVTEWAVRRRRWTGPWVAAFSDWHFHPFWVFPSVSKYFVTSQQQKVATVAAGVPPDRVVVTHLLLSPEYYACRPSESRRGDLRPCVVVMCGGLGFRLERVLPALMRVRADVRFIVVAGSEERRAALSRLLREGASASDIVILGHVDPFPLLRNADLVLSKPGTLSTAEAIFLGKRLGLIVPVPGHEEENARFLQQNVNCRVVSIDALADTLPALLAMEGAAAAALLPSDTPQRILECVRGLGSA